MSHHIDKIIYINLEKRKDRKQQIEEELNKFELPFERFDAISTEHMGILGCTQSHLEVYKLAKQRKYKNVLILEDDFFFLVSKKELEEELTKFFDSQFDYNVCMLSYNVTKSKEVKHYDFVRKILENQSASGYIVNENYYDTLIALYEWAIPLLQKTGEHCNYANDQCWKSLQPKDKWFYFVKRIGKQRDGWSDNAKEYMVYDC